MPMSIAAYALVKSALRRAQGNSFFLSSCDQGPVTTPPLADTWTCGINVTSARALLCSRCCCQRLVSGPRDSSSNAPEAV